MKLCEIDIEATFTEEEIEVLYKLLAKYITYSKKCEKLEPQTQYELMVNQMINEHILYASNIQNLLLAQT